ncbi:MAG: signal recognition particle-docking protein FtsY, partial [Candidatus Thiodiazotropha taylori]
AKGGVVFAIADKVKVPIRFIGVGESIEDLREFDPKEFVEALFETDTTD